MLLCITKTVVVLHKTYGLFGGTTLDIRLAMLAIANAI